MQGDTNERVCQRSVVHRSHSSASQKSDSALTLRKFSSAAPGVNCVENAKHKAKTCSGDACDPVCLTAVL